MLAVSLCPAASAGCATAPADAPSTKKSDAGATAVVSAPTPAVDATPGVAPSPLVVDAAAAIPAGPVATEDPAGPFAIVDRPIAFPAEREELTLEYIREHIDPDADDITIEPKLIVLHYTAGSSAKGTMGYFDNIRLESERKALRKGGAVNVSSHFLVDRDGTIYRLMPETRLARHCIGLNHLGIGIENVGDDDKYPLTAAQVDANEALVRYLVGRFPITHLIGHLESNQMRGHPYFVERDDSYRNSKPDPGPKFLAAVRARVADLALEGAPAAK
jgi:N-acetylmuramoyl-L-alanine amidase